MHLICNYSKQTLFKIVGKLEWPVCHWAAERASWCFLTSEDVTRRCHQKMPPEDVTRRCHQKMSPEDATRRCHQKMSPEHDTKRCHQQMSPDLLVWLNNCTRYHQSWLLPYKNWCWLKLKMAVLNIIFLKPCWPMFFPQVCFLTSHFSSFVGCKFFIEPPWQAFSRLVQHYIVYRPLVTSTDLIFRLSFPSLDDANTKTTLWNFMCLNLSKCE